MYWLLNNSLGKFKKSLKRTIIVVSPNKTAAGCRLRCLSIIESADINLRYQVELVNLESLCSRNRLIALFERGISKIPRIKCCYLKIRLRLRLLRVAKADLAVFGKPYGQHHMEALKIAKRHNTKILSDFCDFHSGFNDTFLEAAHYSDMITAPTTTLASRIYAETSKYPIVIPDKLDYCVLPGNSELDRLSDGLQPKTILWYGLAFANNEPTYSFRYFCRIVSSSEDLIINHGLYVEIISESSDRAKDYLIANLRADSLIVLHSCQWSLISMRQALSRPGFVILPYPEPVESCEKSANRIELALRTGKVVISNGSKLSSLENALSAYVMRLPADSLNARDLEFAGTKQYEQAVESRRILDERRDKINCLWGEAINLALG
jgi:hypothetical protein